MQARKSLHCYKKTFKDNSSENLESKDKSCRKSLNLPREYLTNPNQNVDRNMHDKGNSDEVPG